MALSETEFTPDELAMVPEPDADEQVQMTAAAQAEQQTTGTSTVEEPAADAPSDAPAATTTAAIDGAAATPATPDKGGGDTRAALRAARRAEHRERQRRLELENQLKELQAKLPAEAQAKAGAGDDDMTEAEIAELEDGYHPLVAKTARLAKKAFAALPHLSANPAAAASGNAAAVAQTQFVPPVLPPDFQDAVDDIPDLLAWQIDPDQTLFEAAKVADEYLSRLPAWKGKSHAERFREVVKRVKQDMPTTAIAQAPNRTNPEDAIARAGRAQPSTLSDIGGGAGKDINPANNLERFNRMSDEEILADLARG